MITDDSIVDLSDDEDVENGTIQRNDVNSDTETIILDEETSQLNNNYVKCSNRRSQILTKIGHKLDTMLIEGIYKENHLFVEFIEKCLELESSDGMLWTINRTLVQKYEASDTNYRNSEHFKRVLVKALNKLDTHPNFKYSHIRNLCDTLEFHKNVSEEPQTKRRVELVTLETNLKRNGVKRTSKSSRSTKRRKITDEIIELDDDQRDGSIINLVDDNDVIMVEEVIDDDDEKENENNGMGDSAIGEHGQLIEGNTHKGNENYLVPQIEIYVDNSNEVPKLVVLPIEYSPSNETGSASGETHTEINNSQSNQDKEKKLKMKAIEQEIKFYNTHISNLEEAEVTDDSVSSPYIQCEKYKAKIVKLYEKLCKLTGSTTVKRRKVRLQVLEGHPPGPVRRLESFLNVDTEGDNDPPFPNFRDVVKCVVEANVEDDLGWNQAQIMREASALFTQCGRALQTRRKKREWLDLMATVKLEQVPEDPADKDPDLQAKLEENRLIAYHKEADLIERYALMQDLPQRRTPKPGMSSENNQTVENQDGGPSHGHGFTNGMVNGIDSNPWVSEDDDSNGIVEKTESPSVIETESKKTEEETNNYPSIIESESNELVEEANPSVIEYESNGMLEKTESFSVIETDSKGIDEETNSCPIAEPESNVIVEETNTSVPVNKPESKIVEDTDSCPYGIKSFKTNGIIEETNSSTVKVKQEPVDIARLLDELGDDYTVTVEDIEDPFLVIDICDSSDEEIMADDD